MQRTAAAAYLLVAGGEQLVDRALVDAGTHRRSSGAATAIPFGAVEFARATALPPACRPHVETP
jgi:hypothetical protein